MKQKSKRPYFNDEIVTAFNAFARDIVDFGLKVHCDKPTPIFERSDHGQTELGDLYNCFGDKHLNSKDISLWRRHDKQSFNSSARDVTYILIALFDDARKYCDDTYTAKQDEQQDQARKEVVAWLGTHRKEMVEDLYTKLDEYLRWLQTPDNSNPAKQEVNQSQVYGNGEAITPETELAPHKQSVRINRIEFSNCGRYMAECADDGIVNVFNYPSLEKRGELIGHKDEVYSLDFSSDGNLIATASTDHTAILWETDTLRPAKDVFEHDSWIVDVSISPQADLLATAVDIGGIYLWPISKSGKPRVLKGHTGYVRSVNFSADGRSLISGSADCTAILWDVDSGDKKQVYRGHEGRLYDAIFLNGGSEIATASVDGHVRVFSAQDGELLSTFDGHTDWVSSICSSIDGSLILTGSEDKTARIWDWRNNIEICSFEPPNQRLRVARFSKDETLVATGGYGGRISLWKNPVKISAKL